MLTRNKSSDKRPSESWPKSMWLGLVAVFLGANLAAAGLAWYLTRPKPLPDFAMTDQSGKTLHLADLRGKWTIVFFGYTHCPDVCPAGLANLAKVIKGLGPAAKKVQLLFITLDPQRDTPKVLKSYLHYFDPDFIGATVGMPELTQVASEFGVEYQQVKAPKGGKDYTVDHSVGLAVLDPGGHLHETLLPPVAKEDLAKLVANG